MGLGALTDVVGPERVIGIPVGEVTALAYDSRAVVPGTLFFAVPGVHVDGHEFAARSRRGGRHRRRRRARAAGHRRPAAGG